MLESTTSGNMGNLLFAAILVMVAIAACAGLAFFLKTKFNFATLSRHMNPHARLSIVESLDVDQKRKLILIRKDEIEHLVLIGGQEDLVIESSGLLNSSKNTTVSSPESEQKAQAVLSDNKVVKASNDENLHQNGATEPLQPNTVSAPSTSIAQASDPVEYQKSSRSVPSEINEAELTRLISDALEASKSNQVNEKTVAKAVSMLSSEEEVSDFFDQARSRIFAKPTTTERPREDTDDFQAVLRNQKEAAARAQYRARLQESKAAAPAPRKFDPIPETAEERIKKLKALLGDSNRRLK
ncbi:hypothetical protein [Lentilitoribacter sp. EG35]|uniref:hypothetical protein n=1 Tax=Lentilitoribacter sp. EG35 TaxID=3234192 RepID=UPI00345F85C0